MHHAREGVCMHWHGWLTCWALPASTARGWTLPGTRRIRQLSDLRNGTRHQTGVKRRPRRTARRGVRICWLARSEEIPATSSDRQIGHRRAWIDTQRSWRGGRVRRLLMMTAGKWPLDKSADGAADLAGTNASCYAPRKPRPRQQVSATGGPGSGHAAAVGKNMRAMTKSPH